MHIFLVLSVEGAVNPQHIKIQNGPRTSVPRSSVGAHDAPTTRKRNLETLVTQPPSM
ncbi:hypothetical protein HAX54_016591, partial [Datura stramonium]|nr:hypothetical protein [Datura stramonium]